MIWKTIYENDVWEYPSSSDITQKGWKQLTIDNYVLDKKIMNGKFSITTLPINKIHSIQVDIQRDLIFTCKNKELKMWKLSNLEELGSLVVNECKCFEVNGDLIACLERVDSHSDSSLDLWNVSLISIRKKEKIFRYS